MCKKLQSSSRLESSSRIESSSGLETLNGLEYSNARRKFRKADGISGGATRLQNIDI